MHLLHILCFLFDTDELEIAKIVRECTKPRIYTGYDSINMNIIKSVIKSISIYNLSLSSGILPDDFLFHYFLSFRK